jgi:hypothetical protein
VCLCLHVCVCGVRLRVCVAAEQDATHVVNLAQALEYGGDYDAACTLLSTFLDRCNGVLLDCMHRPPLPLPLLRSGRFST